MKAAGRRVAGGLLAALAFGPAWLAIGAPAASAQAASDQVLIVTVDRGSLQELLASRVFLSLAERGGAALLSMTEPADPLSDLRAALAGQEDPWLGVFHFPTVPAAARRFGAVAQASTVPARRVLVIVVSDAIGGPATNDRLGAVVLAELSRGQLADALGQSGLSGSPPRTLTSDSTRRDGVVTSRDLAETALTFTGVTVAHGGGGGSAVTVDDAPPPIGLYDRYVQQRRLAVPIGIAVGLAVTAAGFLAALTLAWRRSPRGLRSAFAWTAIASPFLALSLLLVGHLSSLSYGTVVPFVIAVPALAALALAPVVRRRGTLDAVALAGAILLLALVAEAAVGWTAALTPLLGGSQLDGGRFFGLPNAFIGLLLGGSVYVAQRLPRAPGAGLIAAAGLLAGSPWTGSNIGAAVTLFAAAGIWWGLRSDDGWIRTTVAAVATVAVGTVLVVFAHRYLTSAPTHITRFAEHAGGVAGLWHKLVDRLGVGVHLIAADPFALVPVIGVLATLAIVLRPPRPVWITFAEAPVWRVALLTILLGSVVAYVVNDSGPAAIGEGFTTSLGALLFVSLLRRNDIMEEA